MYEEISPIKKLEATLEIVAKYGMPYIQEAIDNCRVGQADARQQMAVVQFLEATAAGIVR